MPQPFNIVSQEETESLDLEERTEYTGSGRRFCFAKYAYLPPKILIKLILGLLLLITGVSFWLRSGSEHSEKPTEVPVHPQTNETYYPHEQINKIHDPVDLKLVLEVGKSYLQQTTIETKISMEHPPPNLPEVTQMKVDNTFLVKTWNGHTSSYDFEGFCVDIALTHLDATIGNSDGDLESYNSCIGYNDDRCNSILEHMVSKKVQVYIDSNYQYIDWDYVSNYSQDTDEVDLLGTSTSFLAMDQVNQIVNSKSYLPTAINHQYRPGDSWELKPLKYSAPFLDGYKDLKFSGRSTLFGYLSYHGVESAVIKSEAEISGKIDLFWFKFSNRFVYPVYHDLLGFGLNDNNQPKVSIIKGQIHSVTYWDVQNNIPLYSNVTIEMNCEGFKKSNLVPTMFSLTEMIETTFVTI
mmetsp:Transcript_26399/g.32561  ORF Transcript_26399/g.32561 Transcript_26399/m.32561 type:complete len:409 (+) Transcript_26399:150-1376(+)